MAASVEPHSTADSIIKEIEVILILGLTTGSVDIAFIVTTECQEDLPDAA